MGQPDFTYGSREEYFYCLWVAERKPPSGQAWTLWLQDREAFMANQPAWVLAWRRSVAMQRELRQPQGVA